jgi:hypothetical protein
VMPRHPKPVLLPPPLVLSFTSSAPPLPLPLSDLLSPPIQMPPPQPAPDGSFGSPPVLAPAALLASVAGACPTDPCFFFFRVDDSWREDSRCWREDSVRWRPERRDLQLERCYFRLFRSEFCGRKVATAAIWPQN